MIQKFIDALIDIILFVPRVIFSFIIDAVEFMVGLLPEIEIADLQTLFNSLGGDLLFFLTMFEFDYGLLAIFSALIARFVLRRIPFIG